MTSIAYTIAFGYAYGQMDAEDNNINTSSWDVADEFAKVWEYIEKNGGSRPNMFECWKQFRKTS